MTLSPDTPGFTVVLIIGTILVFAGIIGLMLWAIKAIKVRRRKMNWADDEKPLKSWFSFMTSFDLVLVIGLTFRILIIQPFIVEGNSMEGNLHDKEALLVDKVSYHFEDIKRGDVIVFQAPKSPQDDYIKRVIASPGEEVTITSNKVYINNSLLDEPYLSSSTQTLIHPDTILRQTMGPNEYFVMGDNRENSSDSRSWGAVPKINIIGRAWVIVYPFDRKGIIKNPNPIIEKDNILQNATTYLKKLYIKEILQS